MRLQQILRLAKSSFAAWLALGALFIGFLFGNTPGINGVLGTFIDLSRSESFCRTLSILYLACLIGGVLQKLDLDSLICSRLSSNIGKPAAMVVVPFLLGLFPTVGGAKLSLVFVENLGKETKAQKQDLALINFWFRHTCNFANPLIPGTVLASAISGADLGSIIEITFPLMIISTVYGWKKFVAPIFPAESSLSANACKASLLLFIPTAILCALASAQIVIAMLVTAACAGLVLTAAKLGAGQAVQAVFLTRKDWKLMVQVCSVLFFVEVIKQTSLMGALQNFVHSGIISSTFGPIVVLIPATIVLSILTGLSQCYQALVMPVVAAVYPGQPMFAAIIVAVGLAAQFVTPAHLCLLISAQHFSISVWSIIKRAAPAIVLSFAFWLLFVAVIGTNFH